MGVPMEELRKDTIRARRVSGGDLTYKFLRLDNSKPWYVVVGGTEANAKALVRGPPLTARLHSTATS